VNNYAPHHEAEVQVHAFFTSELGGGDWYLPVALFSAETTQFPLYGSLNGPQRRPGYDVGEETGI
jgi:hypothetical protein